MEITPREDLPAGDIKFEVAIEPVAEGGERLPPVPVAVQGVMREDVQAIPSAVLFGMVRVGETADATILLRSVSGRKFAVQRAELTPKDGKLTSVSSVEGSVEYHLRQEVKGTGTQAGKAVFTVLDQSSGKALTVEVPVSYYGRK